MARKQSKKTTAKKTVKEQETTVFAKDAEEIVTAPAAKEEVIKEVPQPQEDLQLLLEAVNRGEYIGATSRDKLVKAGLLKG